MTEKELIDEEWNDDGPFQLTPWGCMIAVFDDYNIDWSHLTGKMGEHLVNDFMDLMQAQGYVVKADDTNTGK